MKKLWFDNKLSFSIICFLLNASFCIYSITFYLGILTKWKLVFFGTKENKNINKKDDTSLSLGKNNHIA